MEYLILGFLVAVIIFFIAREFWAWYYKATEILNNQRYIIHSLNLIKTALNIEDNSIVDEDEKISVNLP